MMESCTSSAAEALRNMVHSWHEWLVSLPGPALVAGTLAIMALAITLSVSCLVWVVVLLLGPPRQRVVIPTVESWGAAEERDARTDGLPLTEPTSKMICEAGATLQKLGSVPCMSQKDVLLRVQRARDAQVEFCRTSFEQRRILMRQLLAFVLLNQRAICEMSCLDTGKTMMDASLGEITTTCEKLRWICAEGELALRPERRSTGPMTVHRKAYLEFVPLGVIAAIAPWNYPFHNIMNPLIAALFSGNAFIVKPSEHALWSSMYYVNAIRSVLEACGHSPDLVQIVTGGAETGVALIECPGVDKVFFTGSTKVGKMVAKAAAERLLPVVLELGGKDPFVVFNDANWDQVWQLSLRGCFQNAGQNCIGIERIFVQAGLYDKFVEFMQDRVSHIRQGHYSDPDVDVGALTMGLKEAKRIEGLVSNAQAMGARVLCGGHLDTELVKRHGGAFFTPTLVVDVTTKMDISQEEVFGPVMAVFKFETETELVQMMNECPFGLNGAIFSNDTRRAERVSYALRSGMCNVNDWAINYLCQSLPFGGTKLSGSDRFGGIEGLRGCCLMRSVTRDRVPGVRTLLPKPLQYPCSRRAYEICDALNMVVYEPGVARKFLRLFKLVRLFLLEAMPENRSTISDEEKKKAL
ncbi:Aldehyde dehydrogenase 22A1 [Porphyridium purpureum]|uniref:Aldehyde dehydrogenase 22A1 n=1 Tax=Porphyridium purpureum TaxID=35688 RepID=A0A5J4Z140_PORPP|nr:Aldehyde dehydrogenase 22A1 [Porphyridium purpureum]|eukprot:POR5276..scf208_2